VWLRLRVAEERDRRDRVLKAHADDQDVPTYYLQGFTQQLKGVQQLVDSTE
jgi:hypothetical protein